MRSRYWVVMVLAACGDDGATTPDSSVPSSCQVDADCGPLFCNANKCSLRPEWNEPTKLGAPIAFDSVDQSGVAMRGDNLELIFCTSRSATCSDVWHTQRGSDTASFDAPVALPAVNDPARCNGLAVLRADGLELYLGRTTSAGFGQFWRATRASTSVDFDAPVQTSIFASDVFVPQLTMSGDALTLMYSTAPSPGVTTSGYISTRASTADAFAAGTEVPELAGTWSLGLSPDGRYLVTTQEQPRGLFLRIRSTAGTFSNPIAIAELSINPLVVAPSISPDGKTIFFTIRNDTNHNEIWSATRK
jgi:hypothetical protein